MRSGKALCLLLAALLIAGLLPGAAAADDAPLRIVTTIFPVWDWARQIIGDTEDVELTLLLENGVDLHSFQPSAADLLTVTTCDVLIYVGGESDRWVTEALSEFAAPDLTVINLLDLLGDDVRTEELVEGMEAEPEEESEEADEHIWLSLRNAKKLTLATAGILAGKSPEHGDAWLENAARYAASLDELDQRYTEAVAAAPLRTILVGDRFPFRYLTDDYGLSYYAAFSGCSAETEASFQTIVFLAQKVDELSLPAVLTIEGSDHRIAETIIAATREKNQKLLTLNSMQGITRQDVDGGASYLDLMADNLAVLTEALN